MEKAPFLIIEQPFEIATDQVIQQIRNLGLEPAKTFSLQEARQAHPNCSCPHHGTDECDCQLCVILIYGRGSKPVTLLVHGHEGKTWFSFSDTPQQHVSQQMETLIVHSLIPIYLRHPKDTAYV